MDILEYKNERDASKMLEICLRLWEKRSLVPVVGSGFSSGVPTDHNGVIPTADNLKSKLLEIINQQSGYSAQEFSSVENMSLSEVAGIFWDIWDRCTEECKTDFFSYINRNFKDISFFTNVQSNFLKIDWPYIFSLNYDTLIENFDSKYYAIAPFQDINKYYANSKTKVFKLHGDISRYLATGNAQNFILSRDQYVQSLLSDKNKEMLDELMTAFSSKSIVFFGCGLSEELDLLYTAQINLASKATSIDTTHQSIIYISFENEKTVDQPFPRLKQDRLSRYGITTVFRLFGEQESEEFFSKLLQLTLEVPSLDIDQQLQQYSALQYISLPETDSKCREFLLQENLVWKQFYCHQLILPGYIVPRSCLQDAKDLINRGEELLFISGNFYSGKTIFLLMVSQYYSTKKVFVFPSGKSINNTQLEALLKKTNALFCFDTRSLTTAQVKQICNPQNLSALSKNQSTTLIAIDKSDAPIYKYIFESRNISKDFEIITINSKFDSKEAPQFNEKTGKISLLPYESRETLLDYVVKIEKQIIGSSNGKKYFLQPNSDLLSLNSKAIVKALIMLATEIRITAKGAIQFGIFDACNELTKICATTSDISSAVIEKDYSTFNGDSSGFEYVCNSKYWAMRVLSSFSATDSEIVEMISNAYLEIVETFRAIHLDDDFLFYKSSEPYYFFDHIQMLFNSRWFGNASNLVNAIYDKLLQVLSNSFQFMHQKAKGKLIIAQAQRKNGKKLDAYKTLEDARLNISRAIELANQHLNAKHIDETLLHMAYTKGRVYIESSLLSLKFVPNAVDACYYVYHLQEKPRLDVYDYAQSASSDKEAFTEFVKLLMSNDFIRTFSDLDEEKASYLLSRWNGKTIKIKKQLNRRRNSAKTVKTK